MSKNNYKEKYEREMDYIKSVYPLLIKDRENLLKSLIYLEFQVDQQMKRTQAIPEYKENDKMKYHREESYYIYNTIKNSIHEEIEKYFKNGDSKAFEYVPYDDMIKMGFGSSMFFE